MTALLPENETERLEGLAQSRILDTPREEAYDDLTRLAAHVCRVPIATVTLVDRDRQWFKSAVGTDKTEDPREVAFCAHTILGTEPLIVPDARRDPRFAHNPLVTGGPRIRFYAGAPIVTADSLALGTVCVIDSVPRVLTDQQVELLRVLARQVAGRLDQRRTVHALETLLQELRDAQARLARKAALIDISADAILVQEPTTDRIVFWSRGAETLYGWAREDALGCVASSLLKTESPNSRGDILEELRTRGHWQGDLVHTRRDGTRVIVASRWALGGDLGGGAEVLEVNRDVTEQRRLESERAVYSAQQERIAEALQRSLLMVPDPDHFRGLAVEAFYRGAEEDVLVGGDFFDVYAVAEDKVALVVGDATGKGLEAATYTAEVKFALRALLGEYKTPAVALTRLNRFIADKERLNPHLMGQSYVALTLAVVDTATGEVQAATAGMDPPFVLRASGWEALGSGGLPLGVSDATEYQGQRGVLGEGDLLVVTTDGLLEARHPEKPKDFLGVDGLAEAVRGAASHCAALGGVVQEAVGRVRAFAGGAIHDDVCLLIARRR